MIANSSLDDARSFANYCKPMLSQRKQLCKAIDDDHDVCLDDTIAKLYRDKIKSKNKHTDVPITYHVGQCANGK